MQDYPGTLPALDPLVVALAQTVRHWAEKSGNDIRVIHDEQAMLTEPRIKLMINQLRMPHPEFARFTPPVHLTAIEQVNSKLDARVQVADLLAGAARVIAASALKGEDPGLCATMHPFVNETSVWSDGTSWHTLTGRADEGI